jgi:hypothetical protein
VNSGSWPPPPPGPTPPRPDVDPVPARFRGAADRPLQPPRRRRTGIVVVAIVIAATLLVGAIGSIGGIGPGRHLALDRDGQYRFLHRTADGRPYRWDPCEPIHYEVNVVDAPPAALEDVREAIARVAAVSGYRFVFDGTTTRTADQQVGRAFQTGDTTSRWLPLLIVWLPHEHFDYLAETHRAAAFAMPKFGDGDAFSTYESGLIAIDAGGHMPPGFGARYSRGVVLMHELGHVMGLAHVPDGGELMWSPNTRGADDVPDLGLNDWGPGDRAALAILGEHGACPQASASSD